MLSTGDLRKGLQIDHHFHEEFKLDFPAIEPMGYEVYTNSYMVNTCEYSQNLSKKMCRKSRVPNSFLILTHTQSCVFLVVAG